jgi:multiple sugar transport system ATP-binding protein
MVEATVDVTELMGNEVLVYLMTENIPSFVGRFDPRTGARVGNKIPVALNMDRMHIFDKQTEMAIR